MQNAFSKPCHQKTLAENVLYGFNSSLCVLEVLKLCVLEDVSPAGIHLRSSLRSAACMDGLFNIKSQYGNVTGYY